MKKLSIILILFISMLTIVKGQSAAALSNDDQQLVNLQSAPVVLEPTDSLALFKFFVTNPKGEAISGDRIRLISLKTKQIYSGKPDKKGRFDLLLPKGDSLELCIRALGKDSIIRTVVIPTGEELRIYNYELSYSPPRTIILENVYFDTNKTTLKPESFESLNNLVELLTSKPDINMEIYGHTDNVGGEAFNMKLSQGRAESVRAYLIQKGIAGSRLTAIGYGYSKPIDTNDTLEGRQHNRRTEVRILYE